MHQARHHDGDERSTGGEREIVRVRHPQQRIVPEQDVAERTAAERRDTAEQADADPIHAAPAGGKRGRHRLRSNRQQQQHMKNGIAGWQIPHGSTVRV